MLTQDKDPHWDQHLRVAHSATELLSVPGGLYTCQVLLKVLPHCVHIALWRGRR